MASHPTTQDLFSSITDADWKFAHSQPPGQIGGEDEDEFALPHPPTSTKPKARVPDVARKDDPIPRMLRDMTPAELGKAWTAVALLLEIQHPFFQTLGKMLLSRLTESMRE